MAKNIIKILRLNQSIKHIFIFPGFILGYYMSMKSIDILSVAICLISSILIASSNYVINEIVDKKFDKHHDLKKKRSLASGSIKTKYAYVLYFILILFGLFAAYLLKNFFFFLVLLIFIISGLIYNIPPVRLKDIPIVDVISESFNNPIRFMLGFSLFFNKITLPSISLLIGYWFAGAFLMNAKRLSEFLYFVSLKKENNLKKYRTVYNFYNFQNLNALSLFYACLSISMLTIFIIKYKIEYFLFLPFLVLIYSYYHFLSITKFNEMQESKNLIKMKFLLILSFFLVLLFSLLTFYNFESLNILLKKEIIYSF